MATLSDKQVQWYWNVVPFVYGLATCLGMAAVNIGLYGGFVWIVLGLTQRHFTFEHFPKMLLASVLVLLAISFVSALLADHPLRSIKFAFSHVHLLAIATGYFVVQNRKSAVWFERGLKLSLGIGILYSFVQFGELKAWFEMPFHLKKATSSLNGLFSNSITWIGVLSNGILLLYLYKLKVGKKIQGWDLVLYSAAMMVIFLSLQRMFTLFTIGALILLLPGWRKKTLGALTLLLLSIALYVLWPRFQIRADAIGDFTYKYSSARIHLMLLFDGLRAWLDAPILGHGPGSFYTLWNSWHPDYAAANVHYNHPHNIYWMTLAETGILGFVSVLSFFGCIFKYLYDHRQQQWTNPAAIVMGVMCITGLTDVPFYDAEVVTMFALAVGVMYSPLKKSSNN